MKTALSIVLAATLVTTPLKLVLAHAAQQESVSVQQDAPPDSSGHRLIGVPPVTDNTSRLWGNPSDRALLNTELADALVVQDDLGMGAKVVIGIAFIVLGLVIYAAVIKKAAFR